MSGRQAILFLLSFLGAIVSGCATAQPRFLVGVDSIAADVANAKKSYVLLPANKDVAPDDLQFKEFASYVHRALKAQGFTEAPSIEKGDVLVFLAYGIGDPQQHQFSYAVPHWGQTGVSSATTYGTLQSYGSSGTYSGTTTYEPAYGITGYSTHVKSYTTYSRFVRLDAYDLGVYKKQKKYTQLWRTTATSRGESSDLRMVFPIIMAASKPYIATNTGRSVTVTLYEDDQAVVEIKGLVPEPQKRQK